MAPTPEPSTVLLLGSGIVGLLAFGRRKLFA
ncbi:MAG: PEP-CTERM sorting domain-containing protein [Candidatus Acidiferrales bacterium]